MDAYEHMDLEELRNADHLLAAQIEELRVRAVHMLAKRERIGQVKQLRKDDLEARRLRVMTEKSGG